MGTSLKILIRSTSTSVLRQQLRACTRKSPTLRRSKIWIRPDPNSRLTQCLIIRISCMKYNRNRITNLWAPVNRHLIANQYRKTNPKAHLKHQILWKVHRVSCRSHPCDLVRPYIGRPSTLIIWSQSARRSSWKILRTRRLFSFEDRLFWRKACLTKQLPTATSWCD